MHRTLRVKRGSSNLLDVNIKSTLAFKIWKLISLEYYELPNRIVLVIAESGWFKILLSILVFLSVRKLGQWWRKWHVFSMLQPQVQTGFNVSWKLFLNLCSWRWLSPSRNLVKYLIPFRLWRPNMLFVVSLINFKIFFLKILRLGEFWISGSSLFHSMMTDGKKVFLKKLCLILKWGILFAFLVGYGLFNLGIILKRYFGDWSFKFYKSSKVFCTNACVARTPILALQKVSL